MLAALDHPETRLPPVVHVAGTNGKGSTIACMRAMLEAAGIRVHVYTSPHLVDFAERIRLAGVLIDDARLMDLLLEVEATNAEAPITFFEATTAAALLAFARTPADVLLLETGLGGRVDATNIVARPRLTAITPVSYDHEAFLGDTLTSIATEKAGILKPGVTAVITAQPDEAAAAIAARAAAVGAEPYRRGDGWVLTPGAGGFRYRGRRWSLDLPLPALVGPHQIDNAGQAVACVEMLTEFDVPAAAIRDGLAAVEWPARLQRLTEGPLVDILPPPHTLWLDGGHNPAAGQALAAAMRGLDDGRPLQLIAGMLNTKDPARFLAPLAPLTTQLHTVAVPGQEASLGADEIAAAADRAGIPAMPATGVDAALEAIRRTAPAPARVLICGSLYLAGSVLAMAAGTALAPRPMATII